MTLRRRRMLKANVGECSDLAQRLRVIYIIFGFLTLGQSVSFAAETSLSPFIDSVNAELKKNEGEEPVLSERRTIPDEGSYTEHLKKRLEAKDAKEAEETGIHPRDSFIEETRLSDPKKFKSAKEVEFEQDDASYTALEKAKLAPKKDDGAIEDFQKGKSQLHAQKKGDIHQSYGFRYGLGPNRNITGTPSAVARPFNDIYGSHYAPEVSFFYEYQLIHSEMWGSMGIMGMAGISYFHGQGQFPFALENPSGGLFPSTSNTLFQFFLMPFTLAASFRFNLFHFLRPYFVIGPSLITFVEMRNDNFSGNRGHSQGLFYSVGVSLLMDWISESAMWQLYTTQGVQHFYISMDYSRLMPLSGDISFTISGLSLGLTFEF